MGNFTYDTCDLVNTPERFTILPIPKDREDELQQIIGIVKPREKRHIELCIMGGSVIIKTFFRRTSHGELRLHFGKGFKDALENNLSTPGFRLEHVTKDTFRVWPIDKVGEDFYFDWVNEEIIIQ